MSGHTPGPWAATERREYHEILGPRHNSSWFGQQGVWAVAYADTDRGVEEQAANARLIAAAPDLLAALIEILGPLNVCSDNANVRDEQVLSIDMTMGELRKARAAIAKATPAIQEGSK